MPFAPQCKSNFTAGDLIYGLATTRPRLVLHLGAGVMNAGGPATVDQYRKSNMDALRKTDRTAWKGFLRDNEAHPRYGRYGQAIRSFNHDEEQFAAAVLNSAVQNAAWRAKSKFGMEWTLRNGRGQIHFVLDEIDMAAVVTKTHRFADPASGDVLAEDKPRGKHQTEGEKERTITHSELRWIYRNRQNPLVQAGVQFWKSNGAAISPCGPPWTDDLNTTTMPTNLRVLTWRQAWAIYRPETEPNVF